MSKKLDKIKIQGYKSIKDLELELLNLNVLIGANGAGKSNFISFFRLLNNVIENNLETYVTKSGGANTFFYFGVKNTPEIYSDLYFYPNRYEVNFAATDDDKLFFANEAAMYKIQNQNNWYKAKGYDSKGHQKSKLLENKERVTEYVKDSLKNWIVYHFHDTSSTALVKKQGPINDNQKLRFDASNLAAFLYLLQEKYKEDYKNIVKTVQLVAPYFEDFILRPNPLNEETIRLQWKQKGSDEYFDANYLSDGTLRFICLSTVLLQPNLPNTILIDEPELGLHPYAINILGSLIRKVTEDKQVILSTQSVPLINEFDANDIITVDRQDGASIFKRQNQEELKAWLEDYTLGELWEKNLLGGRP